MFTILNLVGVNIYAESNNIIEDQNNLLEENILNNNNTGMRTTRMKRTNAEF